MMIIENDHQKDAPIMVASGVNISFNLKCLNLIMHLAYYIDLNFHSLFFCILKIVR
jgi:hypothetical protein